MYSKVLTSTILACGSTTTCITILASGLCRRTPSSGQERVSDTCQLTDLRLALYDHLQFHIACSGHIRVSDAKLEVGQRDENKAVPGATRVTNLAVTPGWCAGEPSFPCPTPAQSRASQSLAHTTFTPKHTYSSCKDSFAWHSLQ